MSSVPSSDFVHGKVLWQNRDCLSQPTLRSPHNQTASSPSRSHVCVFIVRLTSVPAQAHVVAASAPTSTCEHFAFDRTLLAGSIDKPEAYVSR